MKKEISKSTMKELPELLRERNKDGKYDKLIANAISGRYHDFKNPDDVICGKMELVKDLISFPELQDISEQVKDGYFDESPDEIDKELMCKDLPESMWNILGI